MPVPFHQDSPGTIPSSSYGSTDPSRAASDHKDFGFRVDSYLPAWLADFLFSFFSVGHFSFLCLSGCSYCYFIRLGRNRSISGNIVSKMSKAMHSAKNGKIHLKIVLNSSS
jgi:hypothetical protein